MGDFSARVRTYQDVNIDDNVHHSKNCIMSNHGRLLALKHNCTNLKILNGTMVFRRQIPTSGGGSVVDYVVVEECDLSMVSHP